MFRASAAGQKMGASLWFHPRHDDNTDVTRDPIMTFWNKNHARLEAVR